MRSKIEFKNLILSIKNKKFIIYIIFILKLITMIIYLLKKTNITSLNLSKSY